MVGKLDFSNEHNKNNESQIGWNNEKKFIKALKRGEEWAYKKLYREYAPKIGSLAKSYFGTDDVDDIVQEVMLKIFKGIKKFKGNSSLSTWIYRIALNTCNTLYEKNKKKYEKTFSVENNEDEELEIDIPDKEKDVQKEVTNEILYEKILKALDKLSERERVLIKLRDIDGLSYQEISNILDIPEGTVKSRIHNARKKFQKILEEEGIV